jgi:integrase
MFWVCYLRGIFNILKQQVFFYLTILMEVSHMEYVNTKNLIEQTLNTMQSYGLSRATLNSYKSNGFSQIRKFFEAKGQLYFDIKTVHEFIMLARKRLERGEFSARHFQKLQKAVALLQEYHGAKTLKWGYLHNRSNVRVSEYFMSVLSDYLFNKALHLSSGTMRIIKSPILKFLEFLEKHRNYKDFTDVSLNDVRDFIQFISSDYPAGLHNVIYAVKSFLMFLSEKRLTKIDLIPALQKPARVRKKVLSCFSHEEVESILNQIDRTTPEGKRDYALLFLAVHTGLRSIDIVNLKLTDIDWKNDEIHIIQRKTNRTLLLPLEPDTGAALAEYILKGRPDSEVPYIFLRTVVPYNKLADVRSAGNILEKYRRMAGIIHNPGDGKSFHALRRSMGTWMLEAGVSLTTISQVLGHRSQDSAKPYLSMDCGRLLECGLGLKGIEVTKEALQ